MDSSLVSRAKTALHSAAAKVLKSDHHHRDAEGPSRRGSEQELLNMDVSRETQHEISEREPCTEEDSSTGSSKLSISPPSVLKQLAEAVENGKNFKSITDLLPLVLDPLQMKEKKGLTFSAVKSIVLREKEDKISTELYGDEELQPLIHYLFLSEESICRMQSDHGSTTLSMTNLTKDIRGAPPECFTVRLSGIIGRFKSLQKMASFWHYVVVELRRLWSEGQPVPWMPLDANPDLNSCLLHQQLQAINCCIARKRRKTAAIELLNAVLNEANVESKNSNNCSDKFYLDNIIYARNNSGDNILRLGADHPSEDLTMLETGEPIYSPVMQEGPILTEELIKENEEFVLRTGSVGAGCSQLFSDMQAFKAANPGCVLEDFIRWHSPPDCTEMEIDVQPSDSCNGEGSSRRARLSKRMEKEGNLWRELWESAKPVPALKQTPLFDEDLAVDRILTTLEDIPPSELFGQLFVSALCSSLLIAEVSVSSLSNLSKLFYECKDYIVATCQSGMSNENMAEICKVYETVETVVLHPEEAIMIMDQPEGTTSEEPKNIFRRISLGFVNKDKFPLRRKASKDDIKSDEKQSNPFSQLFDKKTSIFSRKPSKSNIQLPSEQNALDENDWTIV